MNRRGGFIIVLSFIVAFMLTTFPLPDWGQPLRPDWVALFLIYWSMALPDRIGVISGWLAGLLLDVMLGSLLGQYAMCLCIISYLSQYFHARTRIMPIIQQTLTVFFVIVLYRILLVWVQGISGQGLPTWHFWIAPFSALLVWPVIATLLRATRRRFRVN